MLGLPPESPLALDLDMALATRAALETARQLDDGSGTALDLDDMKSFRF